MGSYLYLLLSFVIFFFHLSHSAAQVIKPPGSTGLHLSIGKDTTTLQYITTIDIGDRDSTSFNVIRNAINVVLDLGAQLTWFDCETYDSTSYRPISCGSSKCKAAKGLGCQGCNRPPRPGCTNNTCGSNAYNPFSNQLYAAGLGEDVLEIYSTDGLRVIAPNLVPKFAFPCGYSAQLKGLAFGARGVLGLARSQTSLPAQMARAFKFPNPNKFALCIPSKTGTGFGDIFIGGGPYYMPPYNHKDLSKLLFTTPFLINPVSTAPVYTVGDPSDEYFIGLKSIRVGGIRLDSFKTSLLAIDKKGNGGTKLSTITPYTLLHTSIYQSLVNEFVKIAASKKIKRVASIPPFGACFDAKTTVNASTGPDVPIIDLVFGNGVYWRIYGGNSMVRVKKDVLCLGFLDGGAKPRTSVVLGGHQLENYLLEFDVGSSVLGFSSSLLLHNTSCSNVRVF